MKKYNEATRFLLILAVAAVALGGISIAFARRLFRAAHGEHTGIGYGELMCGNATA